MISRNELDSPCLSTLWRLLRVSKSLRSLESPEDGTVLRRPVREMLLPFRDSPRFGGLQKGGFRKGGFGRRRCDSKLSTPPTPVTCHKRKQNLRCNFGKFRWRSRFSAMRTKAALQQVKNCTATLKKLRWTKVLLSSLSCGFQAPTLRAC